MMMMMMTRKVIAFVTQMATSYKVKKVNGV